MSSFWRFQERPMSWEILESLKGQRAESGDKSPSQVIIPNARDAARS
jgi:hypothetical protein